MTIETRPHLWQVIMYFLRWMLNVIVHSFCVIIILVLIYLNSRLYYQPNYVETSEVSINEDVLHQLNYLKNNLHKGGGKTAQSKYPEGFVFINVLYGLTWADFIKTLPVSDPIRGEGVVEIDWALKQLDSKYAQMHFPFAINPSRGIFYLGWKNYLLGKKLLLQKEKERSLADVQQFEQQCQQIYTTYQEVGKTYLESYKGLAWPADNVVAVASLALMDDLGKPRYAAFIRQWLIEVQQKLDKKTGLIPHEVNFDAQTVMEGAKGSSQSLMLNFLLELDTTFAQAQFKKYQTQFLDYRFGLPGIREYPKHTEGLADVDSGPVLLGIGGSASLVGQRTMALYNQIEIAVGLRNCIESFGAAYTNEEEKIYVLGMEPIADAFIAWANVVSIEMAEKQVGNWRWTFQLLSLILLSPILIFYKKKWSRFSNVTRNKK